MSEFCSQLVATRVNLHFPFTADLAILQFGKSTPTRFVLDFKYPLSPIQAFGIALSTFGSEAALRDRASPKKSHWGGGGESD